nr:PAS domain-containing protein [Myxococcota bacterium]
MGSALDISTLDACFGEAPDPVTVYDRDGCCLYANASAATMLGRPRAELSGRTWRELDLPSANAHALEALRVDVMRTGEARATELASRQSWLEHRLSAVRDGEGRVVAVTMMSRDVSARRCTEQQLRALPDAMPSLVWTTDADGATTFMNRRWEEYTGAPLESGTWHHWQARVPAEDLDATLRVWEQCLAGGEPGEAHFRIRDARGEERWHLARIVPLRREGDRVVAWVGTATDVHEELRAKGSLREALQRLEFHVDNSPLAVIEWDREFRVASWSRGAESIFGWTECDVLGKHPDEWPFVHPEDAENVRRSIASRLSGAEPRQVGSGRHRRKDGQSIHCEWYDSALTDERGDTVSVLSLVLDVTPRALAQLEHEQRLIAETAARAQAELERARFHRLLLHAPALVAILRGPDHVYEFLNERFCETIPEARRLVGTSARGHRADLVEEHFLALLDQVYESGEPYEAPEVPIVVQGSPDRSETLYLTFIYQPIRRADGTTEGIASFAFDVTESVLARKQVEEASRAKDDFLSTLSHELRTPLNAIVGWSHLLLTDALDEPQAHRALEAIDRNAKVQKRLIDDLLDFARMVSGKLGLAESAIDLSTIVGAAIESIRPSVEAKNVKLAVSIEDRPVIIGDADRLQQVVWNLLSNAAKFTGPRGRIEVAVRSVGPTSEGPGSAVIEVRDDGLGIDEPFLPHVFERFRQADSSTTRRHGGLGLGLAIARTIVDMHGGRIAAESDGLGRGTTMRVTLPRADRAAPPGADAVAL